MELSTLLLIATVVIVAIGGAVIISSLIRMGQPNREFLGLYRDLSGTVKTLEADTAELRQSVAILSGRNTRLEEQQAELVAITHEYAQGTKILSEQVIELGDQPAWFPPRFISRQMDRLLKKVDLDSKPSLRRSDVIIQQHIGEFFNDTELRALVFEIDGLSYEDLAGETHRSRAMALVEWMQRRKRLRELLTLCKEKRPEVDWPEIE